MLEGLGTVKGLAAAMGFGDAGALMGSGAAILNEGKEARELAFCSTAYSYFMTCFGSSKVGCSISKLGKSGNSGNSNTSSNLGTSPDEGI